MTSLDEIVVLLRWLAAIVTALTLFAGWAVVKILNALEQLSHASQYGIPHAGEDRAAVPVIDDSKLPELDPWHEDRTVADLVARSE